MITIEEFRNSREAADVGTPLCETLLNALQVEWGDWEFESKTYRVHVYRVDDIRYLIEESPQGFAYLWLHPAVSYAPTLSEAEEELVGFINEGM